MISATFRTLGLASLAIAFFAFAIVAGASAEAPSAAAQVFGWSDTNVAGKALNGAEEAPESQPDGIDVHDWKAGRILKLVSRRRAG